MSLASRARHVKRPSPLGNRPRLFGKLSTVGPMDFTSLQDQMHRANQGVLSPRATTGAYGKPRTKRAPSPTESPAIAA